MNSDKIRYFAVVNKISPGNGVLEWICVDKERMICEPCSNKVSCTDCAKNNIAEETSYKIWCDNCDTWTNEFETEMHSNDPISWICCKACGNGLVMVN